ncbi:Uncharacterised protein [uncultured archaeon]|nr:Uncharacterised protein [uncultured archaeon]
MLKQRQIGITPTGYALKNTKTSPLARRGWMKLSSPSSWKLTKWAKGNKKKAAALGAAALLAMGTAVNELPKIVKSRAQERMSQRAIRLMELKVPNAEQVARIEMTKYAKAGKAFDKLPDNAKIRVAGIAWDVFGKLDAEALARTIETIRLYHEDPLYHAKNFGADASLIERNKDASPALRAEGERFRRAQKVLENYYKMLGLLSEPQKEATEKAF